MAPAEVTVNEAQAGTGRKEQPLTTADGRPLKESLNRALRMSKVRAFLLVAPLLVFILVTFAYPIALMLYRSIDNPRIIEAFPQTAEIIQQWDGTELPPEEVFASLANEIRNPIDKPLINRAWIRLNYEAPGVLSSMKRMTRQLERYQGTPASWKEVMMNLTDRRGNAIEEPRTNAFWATFQRASRPYTAYYYIAALDLQYAPDGSIIEQDENRQIYRMLFWRTLWMAALVTGLCLALGFPVAYLLANLPLRKSNLLMILVLLPFWTSLLVRTTTWIVILQSNGVINDILVWFGIVSDEGRIQMIYNQFGTIVAMTQILMPFMILPLYSVMKGISPSYMRAARSLGANPFLAFARVYLPQTVPGIGAGAILVFILAIGYYITPALVGGQTGEMISNQIAFHMTSSNNWGLAAALGGLLLMVVLVIYWLYDRIVGFDNMKLG